MQILCENNWKSMGYDKKFILFPKAVFKVKSFVDCRVVVLNDEGTISATLVGKISSKSLYDDFCIDMATHPKVGERLLKERFSAEAYLKDKYNN